MGEEGEEFLGGGGCGGFGGGGGLGGEVLFVTGYSLGTGDWWRGLEFFG